MSELLLENLGTLNRIDKSLVIFNDYRNNQMMYLGATGITEKSKVEVDRITPHNFTTLMGKLDEDNSIGAIVVRAHGRQLCLVTKLHLYSKSGYQYFLKFSSYATEKLNMNQYYSGYGFIKNDRMAPIKTAISRCVKTFYDDVAPEGTRKKWDALIIYKDENVDSTRIKRAESQKGMIKNPHENGYDDFVTDLKADFEKRCKEYLDKVRINTTNKAEIADYLMNRAKVDTFKFNNYTYTLRDEDSARVGQRFRETYIRNDYDNGVDYNIAPKRLRLTFKWKGFIPYIDSVEYSNERYIYSSSDFYPLERLGQDNR